MAHWVPAEAIDQLQTCLALATDIDRHTEANEAFEKFTNTLMDQQPLAAELLKLAWRDVIAARRSAAFWERISDVERNMSENIASSHTNLQQNHLRLIQEQ